MMDPADKTVAEILEAVANGTIGHKAAIKALGLETYNDLVDTMHLNGLKLWAHKATAVPDDTIDMLAIACGTIPPSHAATRKSKHTYLDAAGRVASR